MVNKALHLVLAVFVALLLTTVACSGSNTATDRPAPPGPEQTPAKADDTLTPITVLPSPQSSPVEADRVEVVYFHRTSRCSSCRYAEAGTRYTIETYFEDELASGKLVFKALDVQDKANAAIVGKYGAYTSSLFISEVRDGIDHIEEVTDIWFLLGKDEAFVSLVKSDIEEHLRG